MVQATTLMNSTIKTMQLKLIRLKEIGGWDFKLYYNYVICIDYKFMNAIYQT